MTRISALSDIGTSVASNDTFVLVDVSDPTTPNKKIQQQNLFLIPDGSAGTPGLRFLNDTNTGIYRVDSDSLAISTNGTGRLFVDASGNVGVGGAASANGLLRLNAASGFNSNLIFSENSTDRYLLGQVTGDNALRVYDLVANSERLRITSDGKLGVATSTPDQTLSVGSGTADTRMSINGTGQYQLKFTNSGADGFWVGSPGANSLAFAQNDGTTRLLIDSNGKISAKRNRGGTGAAVALEIAPNDTTVAYGFRVDNGTNFLALDRTDVPATLLTVTADGKLGLGTTNPLSSFVVSNGGAAGLEVQPTGFTSAPVILSYNRSGSAYTQLTLDSAATVFAISGTEKARIDSSGRLLVGTSSAVSNEKLTVVGSAYFASGPNTVTLANGATGTVITPPRGYSYINISYDQSTTGGLLVLVFASTSTLTVVSTVDDRSGATYSVAASGRNLQVTNSAGTTAIFYASCMSLLYANG